MRRKFLFVLAFAGFLAGIVAAYVYGVQEPPRPPVFAPAANPYAHGVYAEGIVESDQGAGENVNLYPEVSGRVTRILVREGETVNATDRFQECDGLLE